MNIIVNYSNRKEKAKFSSIIFKNFLKESILDVGCSKKYLKEYILPEVKYIGIDILGNPDFKINLEKDKLNIFDNNSFKTVFCSGVLEHLDNLHEVFDDICRVSKKYIIISLPNNWLNFKFRLIKGKGKTKFYGLPLEKPLDRHKWFFNYNDILNFIRKRSKRNNFRIKFYFSIMFNHFKLRNQLFNIFFKFYYKNKFGFNNTYISNVWFLLEKCKDKEVK